MDETEVYQPDFIIEPMNDFARMHHYPMDNLKRLPLATGTNSGSPPSVSMPMLSAGNPMMQDLIWMSKHQQPHPGSLIHPLKNTIRISSNGVRHKFDGKQWRPLCESPDGYECRNLAFRSSLCQKHFYKCHLFKRPYTKSGAQMAPNEMTSASLKRPLSQMYESHTMQHRLSHGHTNDEEDDCIQVVEDHEPINTKRHQTSPKEGSEPEFTFLTIDSDPGDEHDASDTHSMKEESLSKLKRYDSSPHEFEGSPISISLPKVPESIRLGIPPLTRTEEKSLAHELITQLPADTSLTVGEQWARRRACEIVHDNYGHVLMPMNVSIEWFYDFLLRNPRIPIHFQSWFSNIKSTMPISDQLIDIKMWELKLVTRSIVPSSSLSTGSSSP